MLTCAFTPTKGHGAWRACGAVVLANGMDVVATAVQTVAGAEMSGSLSASVDEAAWLSVAYLACKVFGFLVVPSWAQRVGLVRALQHSVWLLLLACALLLLPAGGYPLALLCRSLQGLGGAGVMVAGMSVMLMATPPQHHAWGQASFSSTTMLGPSLMGYVCGGITDAADWRLAMAASVPLGILALWAIGRPPARPSTSEVGHWDGPGLLLWGCSALALQFVVARGTRYNWDDVSWLLPLLLLGVLAAVAFVCWQRLCGPKRALIDGHALTKPEFRFANITAIASAYGSAASSMVAPLMMRQLYGYAAADVGVALLPSSIACGCGLLFSAWVTATRKFNPVLLIYAGLLLFAAAMGLWCIATYQVDIHFMASALMLRGLGFGLMSVPTAVVAFGRLQGRVLCHGVAIYQMLRQMGTALATLSVTWRLAETQARFFYQFSMHLSPVDPTSAVRLSQGAAQLLARGISQGARAQAGMAEARTAVMAQVHVLMYRACAQEILLVFIGCMLLALMLRSRLVRPGIEGT